MRTASVALLLVAASALVCGATTNQLILAEKNPAVDGTPTYEGREVGEDIASAVPIPDLPFTDTGNTCGFLNDYDVVCPYPESVAPDVVYTYTPSSDVVITANLCASSYDTKLYIFEEQAGNVVCCNDDACGLTDYQSMVENVFLYEGVTYYFVIDGYNEDCGDYVFEVVELPVCDVQPPSGLIPEGEPDCGSGYVDVWNGGCNSDPPVFQVVSPSIDEITYFGTSGTYDDYMRDTDWYRLQLNVPNTITLRVLAEFPVLVFFLDGNLPLGCDDPDMVISYDRGAACEAVELTETIGPGVYWVWVGPSVFSCLPCGLEYTLVIDGYVGPTPVENGSWSMIKTMYR
jgi:hypothetical protein